MRDNTLEVGDKLWFVPVEIEWQQQEIVIHRVTKNLAYFKYDHSAGKNSKYAGPIRIYKLHNKTSRGWIFSSIWEGDNTLGTAYTYKDRYIKERSISDYWEKLKEDIAETHYTILNIGLNEIITARQVLHLPI